jgi:hypothetical protein
MQKKNEKKNVLLHRTNLKTLQYNSGVANLSYQKKKSVKSISSVLKNTANKLISVF